MLAPYFKGLGSMVLTLFVVQRAMPVGIVGGSDLSVITPDHFYATSPYVGAKRLGVEVRKRNDPKNKAVARRAAMCRRLRIKYRLSAQNTARSNFRETVAVPRRVSKERAP